MLNILNTIKTPDSKTIITKKQYIKYITKKISEINNQLSRKTNNNQNNKLYNILFISKYDFLYSGTIYDLLLKYNINISDYIINYSVIIELLNIASETHNLINHNNIKSSIIKKISTEQLILIGDLIYTIVFKKLMDLNCSQALNIFSENTKKMAIAEAKIDDLYNNTDNKYNIENIINISSQKSMALFDCINQLFSKILDINNKDLYIDDLLVKTNMIYTLDKILDKKIVYNKHVQDFIYNKNNIEIIKNKKNRDLIF